MTLQTVLIAALIVGALSIAAAVSEITGFTEALRLAWTLWRERRDRAREEAKVQGDDEPPHPLTFVYFNADKVAS